jgi:hypothetical protein
MPWPPAMTSPRRLCAAVPSDGATDKAATWGARMMSAIRRWPSRPRTGPAAYDTFFTSPSAVEDDGRRLARRQRPAARHDPW